MKFEIQRTQDLFKRGLELVHKIRGVIQLDIELFSRGGLEILKLIKRNRYDIFKKRPVVSKALKTKLATLTTMRFIFRSLFR